MEGGNVRIIEVTYKWAKPLYRRASTAYIILHHEAGSGQTPQSIHQQHINQGWAGIGYHYYVRKDGTIYRGRPENTIGTHCPSRNYDSIAVCFEGNFENEIMGKVQFDAGVWLLRNILTRYPNIKFGKHKDFYATACPGANFPYNDMVQEATMTDEDIYNACVRHANTLSESKWSKDLGTFAEATNAGAMDGSKPQGFVTREQLAAVLKRTGAIK